MIDKATSLRDVSGPLVAKMMSRDLDENSSVALVLSRTTGGSPTLATTTWTSTNHTPDNGPATVADRDYVT